MTEVEQEQTQEAAGADDASRDGAADQGEASARDHVVQLAKLVAVGATLGVALGAAKTLLDGNDEGERDEPSSEADDVDEEMDEDERESDEPSAEAEQQAEAGAEPTSDDEPTDEAERPAHEEATDEAEQPADEEQDEEEYEHEPAASAQDEREDAADEEPEDAADEEPEPVAEQPSSDEDADDRADRSAADATPVARVVERARAQFSELTGEEPESVVSVERVDGGWKVLFDVLELERVPRTTDILATVDVELDDDHNLVRYSREGRYLRGQTGGGES